MTALLITLIIFILYLVFERIAHERRIASVPLRIAVTGTRGKSSVVRMLASVLRESGMSVAAKTTGSQARIVLPDGSEEDIRRRGIPSVIEQKSLVKKAPAASSRRS